MTRKEAIESFKYSNKQAKARLKVEKMRMDIGEIKELEFYIERDDMAIKALERESQTFEWCTDCREYDQEKHCCHRWSKVIRNAVEEIKQTCEDAISRSEALKALDYDIKSFEFKSGVGRHMNEIANLLNTIYEIQSDNIKALPPVQPKPVECEDAISRYDALKLIRDCGRCDDKSAYGTIYHGIKHLPPVQTKSKTGQWVLLDECSNSGYYCSECHKKLVKEGWSGTVKKIKFCPNCGCRMVEPQESD